VQSFGTSKPVSNVAVFNRDDSVSIDESSEELFVANGEQNRCVYKKHEMRIVIKKLQ
jgi:hypothetical protein